MSFTEFFENFRNLIPYYLFLIIPILIAISPINPVEAAQQFKTYRMQHFDLHGSKFGSRSVAFNFEVTSLSKNLRGAQTRKCLILYLYEVTLDVIKLAAHQHFGGILIVLPNNWSIQSKQHFMNVLESELLRSNHQLENKHFPAIYFTYESPDVIEIYNDIKYSNNDETTSSALKTIVRSLFSTGYQLIIPTAPSAVKSLNDFKISNIHGKLLSIGLHETFPTIVLVAHYDATGLIDSASFGYDSNASGVVALLELARYLALLYSHQSTQPRCNFVFLLSGAGKLSYLGTKRWIDDHLDVSSIDAAVSSSNMPGSESSAQYVNDPTKSGDSFEQEQQQDLYSSRQQQPQSSVALDVSLLNNVALVVCLEGLAWGDDSMMQQRPSPLRVHVSRPPKNDSVGDIFFNYLTWADQILKNKNGVDADPSSINERVEMVHKKINLKDEFLGWEHERFSLSKLPGLTVSRYDSHLVQQRRSILDDGRPSSLSSESKNNAHSIWIAGLRDSIHCLAEALHQLVYDSAITRPSHKGRSSRWTPNNQSFVSPDLFKTEVISSLVNLLTRQSRATAQMSKDNRLVHVLEQVLARHLGRHNVKSTFFSTDKRDPDFVLYENSEHWLMEAHKVKPIVFEIFLTLVILAYLGVICLVVHNFKWVRLSVNSMLKIPIQNGVIAGRK